MTVFIPREGEQETRVAATPTTVKSMSEAGLKVMVEKGAGEGAAMADKDFEKAGAEIGTEGDLKEADVILAINPPSEAQVGELKSGALWISFLLPEAEEALVKKLTERKVSVASMNLIPRISRAQKMDALSSQSNLAGYKAVLMAADALPKIFPLMMTAAGTINPAKIVVIGAGVAGLQAIATAKRLGAQVEASDVRPAVKEQVESLGGKFIEVEFEEEAEDKGGYAKAASKEFLERQAKEVAKRVAQADIVITTALIPGRKAPVLVTEEMVKSMASGSVIVDMAAVAGGNCALTEPGQTAEKHGVKIMGHENIPALIPTPASQVYARNTWALLESMLKEGKLTFDMEDEVTKGCLVTHNGKILTPAAADLTKGNK